MVSQQRKIERQPRSAAGSEVLSEVERIDMAPVADVRKALLGTDASFGSGVFVPHPQHDPSDQWALGSEPLAHAESRNSRAAVRPSMSCRSAGETLPRLAMRPTGSGSPMSNG